MREEASHCFVLPSHLWPLPHTVGSVDRPGSLRCRYFTLRHDTHDTHDSPQVMPQLLMELGLGLDTAEGGLDWGSLYIFTCSKSCSIQGYVREEIQLRNFERTNLPGT